jgi:host cell factor
VKAGERQWCDVGIFKNNSALVSQFYLLPKGKQSISKVTIGIFLHCEW